MTEQLCRICFEADPTSSLMTPCDCRGSQEFVHLDCLQSWQASVIGNSQLSQETALRLAHSCGVCKAKFSLTASGSYWQRIRRLLRMKLLLLLAGLILIVATSPLLISLVLVFMIGCRVFGFSPYFTMVSIK